jgi:gliding motility-associated-like protein
MRTPRLLVFFLLLLTFPNSKVFSQINNPHLIADVFSQDSLQGFDINQANINALVEGYFGQQYTDAIKFFKRQFVITKYNLYRDHNGPQRYMTNTLFGNRYSSGITSNAPCVNEDFEAGTMSGWTASVGINVNSQTYPTTPTSVTLGSDIAIMTTAFTDAFVGAIPASPLGGTKVVKIGNSATGAVATKLVQTFSVTPSNYLFDLAYWAVMQDAGAGHTCTATPYMLIKIFDQNGNPQSCPVFSIVAPATGGCSGVGPLTWVSVGTGSNTVMTSNGWQKFSIDLTNYITSPYSNITIEVVVCDCALTGHFGYAYFDAQCNTMNLSVNSNTLSMVSPTIYPQVICGGTATMVAPSGLVTYTWAGPTGSNTSQTMVTTVPGNYTLTMNPPGICNPISKVVALSFVPPTTVSASPANLCTGSTTTSTLTASGASQYTWSPGGSTLSTIVVSPIITTIYTLTAKTGTCVGDFTVQVTVNPQPSVSVVSSNSAVCAGQSAQLTAFNANTYQWFPGGTTGNPITVSPTSPTTYTVVGTAVSGCTNTATVSIGISSPPTVMIFPISPTLVCTGGTVSMIAAGANTVTWYPGGIVSLNPTFTVFTSTTFTAVGASGSCTNAATINVSVDPGPSMTVTPSPTIVCPGGTTTLSVVSPAAVGSFTWNPGSVTASSITVTSSVSGGYSVTAKNALGCSNTQTANPNISPLPSLTISPSSPTVCFGGSVTVTASGATSYTWMPGNLNGSSVSLSPTINTTYTVTGANAAGCTSQTTIPVSVISQPTLTASASPSSFCSGNCFTMNTTGVSTFTANPASLCPTITTNYVVTGTGANGCPSNSVGVTVTVNTGPNMSVTANPASICVGSSSTLSATGATSYTWSTGAFTSSIIVTPSSTTVYTVTGINGFGCTTVRSITVTVVPLPTISITPPSPTICAGSNITLTANGGTSYTWSPGGSNLTSIVVNPTINTTYTVVGSNGACTGQANISVSVVPIPTISANYSPPSVCAGSCATLVASGATTYTINGGLSAIACPVVSTNYTVTGSSGGCISNAIVGTLTVTPGPPILASANPTNICPGDSSLVSATGATSYTWQPGGIAGSSFYAKPLATTIYTVSGSNGGCPGIQTVTVTVTPAPSISVTASPTAICAGGSVTLTATGAGNYFWNPGSLSGSPIFVAPTVTTTYTVTGNTGACTGSANITVVVNPVPTVNINASALTVCAGSPVTMTATGASSYTWSTGSNATVITVSPSSSTTYTLRGSSAGCLSNVASVIVTVNPIPIFSLSKNPASICPGGSATLTASGTTSYTWMPVNLTGSSIIVSPGSSTTYTVTGSNGACTSTQTINLPVNPGVTVNATVSPSNACSGNPVNLSATGANNYTWNPGGLTGANVTITASVSTIFTVVGTNTFGCSGQSTATLNVSPSPTVTISPSSVGLCPGSCATLVANGASTYTWNIGSTGPSIVVCPTIAAVYNYSVIGSSGGCTGMGVASVTVSTPPTINANASPLAVCPGGTSTLSATGGTSYTWTPGNLNGSPVIVNPTISTVYTVTGSNGGCTNWDTVQVTVSPVPILNASANPTAVCPGQSSTLSVTGGSFYTWNPGNMTGSSVIVTPSVSTLYTVASNVAGCTGNGAVVVIVKPAAIISATATPVNLCSGVVATLSASGGTSYVWQPGGGTGSPYLVIPVVSTTYTVTGTSTAGCTGSAIASVNVGSAPNLSISATNNTICAGSSVTLTGSGATSYTWNPGGSPFQGIVVTPSITTVYTLIGSNGTCTSSLTYTVFVLNGSPLAVNASSNTTCSGFTVALSASGANSYTWMPGPVIGNPIVVTPTTTTTYTVIGSNGSCTSTAAITINILQLPNVNVTANPSVLCQGGTTTLTATGAITYSWLPSLAGGSTFVDSPVSTTIYTVVGFDSNGCPNFDTTTVNVLQPPNISIAATPTAVCSGSTGTLTATGATSYTWNTGALGSTAAVSPTSPTTYSVIGSNGACTSIATIFVGVNPLPFVSATGTPIALCSGETVTLTAFGASNYTWNPPGIPGSTILDNPLTTTAYTVTGEDSNGCKGQAVMIINVTPGPTLSAVATPTAVCGGNPITLNANGANTYTWNPSGQMGASITETPAITTVYTVTGTDGNGCNGTATVNAIIIPTPTLSVSPLNASLCLGSITTLTASGATGGYTWMPDGIVSPTFVVSPTVTTTYTLVGDNGGICFSTFTVSVYVHPLPANVNATSIGTVSCNDQTAQLFGACTDTAVTYSWTGPQGYSANTQNATVTGIWGIFTLTVVDNLTGCAATATVNVPTDGSIPLVTATTSGSITCVVSTVTLNAAHTTTNPGYSWIGPGAFTSTIQSPTATLPGNYTITVTDLSSTCTGTAVVTVGTHTRVTITASIALSSCSGGLSNNDGSITVTSFTTGDKYDIVTGTTYTGTATYANAAIIQTSGILASNLANPTNTLAYTIRLFDAQGCIKDTTMYLIPVDCSLRTLGIAKAVSEPILNTDGTYNVTYTVTVHNYDTGDLTDVALTDNLTVTFPSPASFTVIPDSTLKLTGTSLGINTAFDGSTQTNLLSASSNTLAHDSTETMRFCVKVKAGVFFQSYNNTVLGTALNVANKTMLDSSNIGLDPDPDNDKNPYNNNKATPVEFKSNIFFGITKVGEIHKSDNASFDVSYTVTIHNLGNDTLRNVSLNDSLFQKTVTNPATYSMRSGPVLSGSGLIVNSGYNGKQDIHLIDPTVSKMYPRTSSSISFVINVVPGTITELINSAYGNATAAKSATENIVVSDTSGNGTNPDVNHNEIWNEPADNIPTVLLIPTDNDIFIPQGFSPNSDNINDVWVIKNLPKDGENAVTIYNRWGNKVYSNSNYDNSWDGTPNAPGTLGKNKLPDGTYYFILEMKGSGRKPVTGFVVLQY